MASRGASPTEMGGVHGRAPSTISRDLRRNAHDSILNPRSMRTAAPRPVAGDQSPLTVNELGAPHLREARGFSADLGITPLVLGGATVIPGEPLILE